MQQLKSYIHQLEGKESAQQLEIEHLKSKGMEMDKYIRQLNVQVEKLQAHQQTKSSSSSSKAIKLDATETSAADDVVVLQNGSISRGISSKAVAMPTSCGELSLYGYTLPGFYMVKGSSNTVNTIFCDFSLGFGNPGNSISNVFFDSIELNCFYYDYLQATRL